MTRFVTEYASIPQTIIAPESLRRQVDAEKAFFRTTTIYDGLPGVKARVLVTNGAEDVVVPPVNARRLAQRIPGARLALFEGAGHTMMFQDVDRFVQVVRTSSVEHGHPTRPRPMRLARRAWRSTASSMRRSTSFG